MVNCGKEIRISRILKEDGKSLILPIDHGAAMYPSEYGELKNPLKLIKDAVDSGIDALIMNPGLLKAAVNSFKGRCGIIARIGTNTKAALSSDPTYQISHITVEDALTIGADGVCYTICIGAKSEAEMIKAVGKISMDCERLGVPFINEIVIDETKVKDVNDKNLIAYLARFGEEMGADILKLFYKGDFESFKETVVGSVTRAAVGLAGGDMFENNGDLYKWTKDSINNGVRCFFIGRNVFINNNPKETIKNLAEIIHGK